MARVAHGPATLAALLALALASCAALPQDPDPDWEIPEDPDPTRPASQVPS